MVLLLTFFVLYSYVNHLLKGLKMSNGKRSWLVQNLANFITILGLFTTLWFLVVGINYPDMLWLVLLLGVVTGITDFIDGKIARYLNIRTSFGAAIDRLRDKVFVCSAIGLLFWQYWPDNGDNVIATLTETLVILMILLEFLIFSTLAYGLYKKIDVTAGQNGKIKMFGEFFAIAFWLISITIDKYYNKISFNYVVFIVDFILLISFYFGTRGFIIYCQKYNQILHERNKR